GEASYERPCPPSPNSCCPMSELMSGRKGPHLVIPRGTVYIYGLCTSRQTAAPRGTDVFDQLSEKLDGVLSGFRQRGVLTEPMIREGLREIRRVLLEADVNYQVTREFLKRVEEKALGEQVLKSVSPGQQIVRAVHEELTAMLGEKKAPLAIAPVPPTVIMMVGLQG